jgi:hypothetical protein
MIKPTLFMAAIRPAAAGSAVAGAVLALLAAATLCSGSSSATGDEAELIVSTRSMGIITRGRVLVPAMYVFGDSLVDAGNNDFLPAPAPKAVPPNGVDLADIIGKLLCVSRVRITLRFLISPDRACAPISGRRRRR